MPLPFGPEDFNEIVSIHGEPVIVTPRTAGAADALGEKTYTDGSPTTIQGVVQDLTTNDLKRLAGIFVYGDRQLFTRAADAALQPTDRLTIGSKKWLIVQETTEESAGTVIFREYLIRRTAP